MPPTFSIGLHYGINWAKLFTRQEIDEFIALYENSTTSEKAIHDFLKQQPKFLYALGAYQAALSEVSFDSTIKNSSGEPLKLRPDFFLQETNGIWDVVELKKADFGDLALIVGQVQRRRFAAAVEESIAQVKTYLRELDKPEVQKFLFESKILVDQPQAWLIIGRDKDLPPREMRLLQKELPHQIRIVTYDALCNLAKERAVIATSAMLLPCINPIVVPLEIDEPEVEPPAKQVRQEELRWGELRWTGPQKMAFLPSNLKTVQWTVAAMKVERSALERTFERQYWSSTPRPRTQFRPFINKLKKP